MFSIYIQQTFKTVKIDLYSNVTFLCLCTVSCASVCCSYFHICFCDEVTRTVTFCTTTLSAKPCCMFFFFPFLRSRHAVLSECLLDLWSLSWLPQFPPNWHFFLNLDRWNCRGGGVICLAGHRRTFCTLDSTQMELNKKNNSPLDINLCFITEWGMGMRKRSNIYNISNYT